MYNEKLGVIGYEKLVKDLSEKVNNPKTPQGEVKEVQNRLYEAKRLLNIAKREEYEKITNVSVYGSDDYVGATAGDLSFYFGYEVTKCPVKSHKNEDDCYNVGCEKREWLFQVTKNDEILFEMTDSQLSYPEADDIERKLIVGMAHYIKLLNK